MSRTTAFIVVGARVAQVTFGFMALGFIIAICGAWEANLGLGIPAAACMANVAVFGLFALLAGAHTVVQWSLVLLMDVIALACSCATTGMLMTALGVGYDYFYSDWPATGLAWPPLVFAWICVALLLASVTRSYILWSRSRRSLPEVQAVKQPQYESWDPPAQERNIVSTEFHDAAPVRPSITVQDHYADAKSTTSTRPISTIETTAHWSHVSRTPTASIMSSETKGPPSYASPQPSRTPTTVHRKPLY